MKKTDRLPGEKRAFWLTYAPPKGDFSNYEKAVEQVAAHQQLTSDWWNDRRHRFDLFVSPRVLAEAGSGDTAAAARRLAELEGIPVLALTPEARSLATRLVGRGLIPERSVEDAAHVAIATVHGMDHLLTWNCRHMVNAEILKRLATVAQDRPNN